MLKNIARIEFQIVDRLYQFTCDNDAPIEHIKEAFFQMQKCIGQIEDNIKAKLADKEAEKTEEKASPTDEAPITEV